MAELLYLVPPRTEQRDAALESSLTEASLITPLRIQHEVHSGCSNMALEHEHERCSSRAELEQDATAQIHEGGAMVEDEGRGSI